MALPRATVSPFSLTGSEEDLISPQLATKLQCTMQPFDLDVDAFTPGICTRITQIATKVQFSVQQAPFERDFLVSPLTGCDMLIGNPWMTTHVPLIDSKSSTFFIIEDVPSPITITCDRSLPGVIEGDYNVFKRGIWYWSGFCKASCRQGEGASYVKRDVKHVVSGFAASFLLTTAVVSSDLLAAGSAHALDSTIVQTAFQRACVGCHVGGGNIIQPGATLTSSDLQRNGLSSTDDIYKIIYSGKGRMPGFGERCAPRGQCTFGPRLSDKEIRSLADFVRLQADQGWKQ
ncbi:hypothetical protein L7F22_003806 [Adiantum nelumboides]|nr:hypothetical protein [Adiantum nelumboides]